MAHFKKAFKSSILFLLFFSSLASQNLENPIEPKIRSLFEQAEEKLESGKATEALQLYLLQSTQENQNPNVRFLSLYKAGLLLEAFGDFEEALKCFFKAHALSPETIDPLFRSATIYRELGNPFLGYLLIQHALSLPTSFATNQTELLIELANCTLLSGNWKEGLKACNELLLLPHLPESSISSILSNKKIAEQHLLASKTFFEKAQPKVSIICPTYNRPDRHANLYQAFCEQTYPNKELLVADDSPTPSSFFLHLKDPRVRYVKLDKRASIGFKRNLLIGISSGELIAHFDDDDYYAPNYLATMVDRLEDQDLVKLSRWISWRELDGSCWEWDTRSFQGQHFIIAGNRTDSPIYDSQKEEEKNQKLQEVHHQSALQNTLGFGFSYLYRKSLWIDAPFEDLYGGEDYHFIEKALHLGKKVSHFDDLAHLCLHVLHPQNSSFIYPQTNYDPSYLVTLNPSVKHWMTLNTLKQAPHSPPEIDSHSFE